MFDVGEEADDEVRNVYVAKRKPEEVILKVGVFGGVRRVLGLAFASLLFVEDLLVRELDFLLRRLLEGRVFR